MTPAVLFVDHTGMMGGAQHSLLDIAEAHRERGAIALLEDGRSRGARGARRAGAPLGGGGSAARDQEDEHLSRHRRARRRWFGLARADRARGAPIRAALRQLPQIVPRRRARRHASRGSRWSGTCATSSGGGHFSAANVRAVIDRGQLARGARRRQLARHRRRLRRGGGRAVARHRRAQRDRPRAVRRARPRDAAARCAPSSGSRTDAFLVGCFSRLHPWKGQTVLLDAMERHAGRARTDRRRRAVQRRGAVRGRASRARRACRRTRAACTCSARATTCRACSPRATSSSIRRCWPSRSAACSWRRCSPAAGSRRRSAGGVPEVVTDGETGVLVPPGDARALDEALEALRRDAARAAALARRGAAARAARASRATRCSPACAACWTEVPREGRHRPRLPESGRRRRARRRRAPSHVPRRADLHDDLRSSAPWGCRSPRRTCACRGCRGCRSGSRISAATCRCIRSPCARSTCAATTS